MGSDFNGDGRDDILWLDVPRSRYTTWLADGDGGFAQDIGLPLTFVPADWTVWGLGDFNGDGRDDVLWRHQGGIVTNWLGMSDGSFANNHSNSAHALALDWSIARTGDFNGDGRDDVLLRSTSGMVSNWLSTPSGGFEDNFARLAILVPSDWTIAGTGDFNGDGFDDVLWRHDGGLVTNWLGGAGGGFVNNHLISAIQISTDWQIEGTGDFNGDGRDDVLWRQRFSSVVETWLGRGDGGFANNHANAQPGFTSDWRVLQTGDYNGDGRDDILWGDAFAMTNWLGTDSGRFIGNDQAAARDINRDWLVQPNPSGIGFWDY